MSSNNGYNEYGSEPEDLDEEFEVDSENDDPSITGDENSIGSTAVNRLAKVAELRNKVVRAQAAAGSAKVAASSVISALIDPVTWIVIAVIVAITLVITGAVSAIQVFGQNENADGCFGISGGGGASISSSPVNSDPNADLPAKINSTGSWLMSHNFDFLGGQPMTKNQSAGVMGNFIAESGITFAKAELKGPNARGALDRMSNAEADRFTKDYAPAGLGLAQWTWNPGRAGDLLNLANSMGMNWYDADVQLTLIKNELDASYGKQLLAAGFNDPSKTPEDLAVIFHNVYERSADKSMAKRQAGARTFIEQFTGAGGGGSLTGGSCVMGAVSSNFDTTSTVGLAISLSKENTSAARVPRGNKGMAYSKQEFLDAKAQAEQLTGVKDRQQLYADCNRFVGTVVALTMDPDYIKVGGGGGWPDTSRSYQYLKNSPKWEAYTSKSQAQPGDVWITNRKGHVILYLGDYNGTDSIAHASYLTFTPAIQSASYVRENMVDTGGRQYTGFRYIGG